MREFNDDCSYFSIEMVYKMRKRLFLQNSNYDLAMMNYFHTQFQISKPEKVVFLVQLSF
jgi:hypothetical protein